MVITCTLALLVAAVVSVVLTGVVRRVAVARGLLDRPTEARRVHRQPTPRVGGVAIAAAFLVSVGSLAAWRWWSDGFGPELTSLLGLVGGGVLLVGVGLVDDLVSLRPRTKLAAQLLAAGIAQWCGLEIESIGNPLGPPLELGWLAVPVTTLWIVGITNAINLIDGLDGLAAGTCVFTLVTIFVISVVGGNAEVALVTAALVGALLGFLRHNFHPATIFMGDSGSLFLGHVLATTAIWGSTKSSTTVSLLIPLLCLGLPIADTSLAIVRRFVRGVPISSADREHIHHWLLARGMTHRGAVLTLYGGAAFLSLAALGLEFGDEPQRAAILAVVGVTGLGAARVLGVASWRDTACAMRYGLLRKHRTPERLRLLERFGTRIRKARSIDELHDVLHDLAMALDVTGMSCRIEIECSPHEPRRAYRWAWAGPDGAAAAAGGAAERVELCFPLDEHQGSVSTLGTLTFWWSCPSPWLQIPEQPLYEWLALLLRRQLLALQERQDERSGPLRAAAAIVPPVQR